ncbi:MAG TPA: lipopolysaccharide biosynthesis protein [Caulobacteraceae bacterium]
MTAEAQIVTVSNSPRMFWRGVVGYLPVNLVQGVVGLLAIVTFTRMLSPAQYGVYALGFSAMNLAHTLFFTWMEAAMARFHARAAHSGEIAEHFATLFRAWLVTALIFSAVSVVAGLLWPAPLAVKIAVGAGMASILVRSLIKLVQERRRASGEVGAAARLDMIQTVGGLAIGLGLILIGYQAAGAIAALGMVAAACLVWALPAELRQMRGGRFEAPRARAYAAYGLPIAASLVFIALLSTADRFLLAAFLGDRAVGVYHAGYSLANRTLDVMFIWMGMAGGPAMVMALERGGKQAMEDLAREQSGAIIALTLPAAIGLALVARPLAGVLVGPALSGGAAHVTPWIALSAFCAGITIYYLNLAFTLARRTSMLLLAMAIPAVANIGLNLVLIPRFGLDGALWATAASYGLGAVASFVLGRRCLALPIPLGVMARAGAAGLVMALVVMRLPALGGLPELLLKSCVGAAVYGALAMALDIAGMRSRGLRALMPARGISRPG